MRQVTQCEPGAIGAETKIRGVAETQHAGETEEHIKAHRGQPEHKHACRQRGIATE